MRLRIRTSVQLVLCVLTATVGNGLGAPNLGPVPSVPDRNSKKESALVSLGSPFRTHVIRKLSEITSEKAEYAFIARVSDPLDVELHKSFSVTCNPLESLFLSR